MIEKSSSVRAGYYSGFFIGLLLWFAQEISLAEPLLLLKLPVYFVPEWIFKQSVTNDYVLVIGAVVIAFAIGLICSKISSNRRMWMFYWIIFMLIWYIVSGFMLYAALRG